MTDQDQMASNGDVEEGAGAPGLERRLRRLEEIVKSLDSDGLELEEALALFEEGVGHVRESEAILTKAELRVQELIGAQGEESREMPRESGNDED